MGEACLSAARASGDVPSVGGRYQAFLCLIISRGLGTITGVGHVRGSIRLPVWPHCGHVHTSVFPRLFASIVDRDSSIENPHAPTQCTSGAFRGGTRRCRPLGPRFRPGLHGIAPFLLHASSFASERERPPRAAHCRRCSRNVGLHKCRGVAQPRKFGVGSVVLIGGAASVTTPKKASLEFAECDREEMRERRSWSTKRTWGTLGFQRGLARSHARHLRCVGFLSARGGGFPRKMSLKLAVVLASRCSTRQPPAASTQA